MYYRMYNRGFGVSIAAGVRISSLSQSIHRKPIGHRNKEFFREFKRPAREFKSRLHLVSKYRMSENIGISFLPRPSLRDVLLIMREVLTFITSYSKFR
jgi:hypothetical protein